MGVLLRTLLDIRDLETRASDEAAAVDDNHVHALLHWRGAGDAFGGKMVAEVGLEPT